MPSEPPPSSIRRNDVQLIVHIVILAHGELLQHRADGARNELVLCVADVLRGEAPAETPALLEALRERHDEAIQRHNGERAWLEGRQEPVRARERHEVRGRELEGRGILLAQRLTSQRTELDGSVTLVPASASLHSGNHFGVSWTVEALAKREDVLILKTPLAWSSPASFEHNLLPMAPVTSFFMKARA